MVVKSKGNKLAKNFVTYFIAEVVQRGLTFLLIVFLARMLLVEDFGLYSFAISVGTILASISDLGLTNLVLRDVSRNKNEQSEHLRKLFTVRIILAVGAFGLFFAATFILGYATDYRLILWLLVGSMLVSALQSFLFAFLQAKNKIQPISHVKVTTAVLTIGLSALTWFIGWGLIGIAASQLVAMSIGLIITVIILPVNKITLPDSTYIKKNMKAAIFFIGTVLLYTIIFRADILMLHSLDSDFAVGLYNAAYTIISVFLVISSLFVIVFYETLCRATLQKNANKIYNFFFKYLLAISIPVTIILNFFGPYLLELLFDTEYIAAGLSLSLLSLSLPFLFVNGMLYISLEAHDRQKRITVIVGIAAIINIVFNTFLIPKYGLNGAAISTTVAEIFICGCLLWQANKLPSPIRPKRNIVRVIGANIILGLLIWVVKLPWFVELVLSVPAYLALLIALRVPRVYEWHWLREIEILRSVIGKIEHIPVVQKYLR